jgi:osmotically-inducible protein OsmY
MTWRDERTATDVFVRQLAVLALERSAASQGVDAFVRHGCVTLTGTVSSPLAKLDAERAVRSVPGVSGVANEIAVAA